MTTASRALFVAAIAVASCLVAGTAASGRIRRLDSPPRFKIDTANLIPPPSAASGMILAVEAVGLYYPNTPANFSSLDASTGEMALLGSVVNMSSSGGDFGYDADNNVLYIPGETPGQTGYPERGTIFGIDLDDYSITSEHLSGMQSSTAYYSSDPHGVFTFGNYYVLSYREVLGIVDFDHNVWRLELELDNPDYVHAQGDTLLFSLGLPTHYVNGTPEGQIHVVSYNPADKFEMTRYNTSIMVDGYNALQFQWMEAVSDTEVYFAYDQNIVNSAFLIVYRFDLSTSETTLMLNVSTPLYSTSDLSAYNSDDKLIYFSQSPPETAGDYRLVTLDVSGATGTVVANVTTPDLDLLTGIEYIPARS